MQLTWIPFLSSSLVGGRCGGVIRTLTFRSTNNIFPLHVRNENCNAKSAFREQTQNKKQSAASAIRPCNCCEKHSLISILVIGYASFLNHCAVVSDSSSGSINIPSGCTVPNCIASLHGSLGQRDVCWANYLQWILIFDLIVILCGVNKNSILS